MTYSSSFRRCGEPTCQLPGCNDPTYYQAYIGKCYCPKHYEWLLFGELTHEHRQWQPSDAPSDRFKILLARLGHERLFSNFKEKGLRNTTVRGDRTRNFKKTPYGCTFEVTRHPGAIPDETYCGQAKVQTWDVDIFRRQFNLISERDKVASDPDPEY
jgi:hypothetical protein